MLQKYKNLLIFSQPLKKKWPGCYQLDHLR